MEGTGLIVHLVLIGLYAFLFASTNTIRNKFFSESKADLRKRSMVFVKYDPAKYLHPVRPNFVIDTVFAFVYLTHFVYPACFLLVLLFSGKIEEALKFIRCFLAACLVWTWCHLLYAVSPPWRYFPVMDHTGTAYLKQHREAGFARVDAWLGINLFRSVYSTPDFVDGAFPSGHVLWTSLVLLNNVDGVLPSWLTVGHTIIVVCAALRSCHHYVIDCVAALGLSYISTVLMP